MPRIEPCHACGAAQEGVTYRKDRSGSTKCLDCYSSELTAPPDPLLALHNMQRLELLDDLPAVHLG